MILHAVSCNSARWCSPDHPGVPTRAIATPWDKDYDSAPGNDRELLGAAEAAVRTAGHRALDVETQDINVPACRLYSECGYALVEGIPHGYPDAPHEAKLLWSKQLA
jgi:hypothetical protein